MILLKISQFKCGQDQVAGQGIGLCHPFVRSRGVYLATCHGNQWDEWAPWRKKTPGVAMGIKTSLLMIPLNSWQIHTNPYKEVSAWLVRTVTHRFSIYPNTLPATIIAGLAYIRLQVGPIVTPPGRRGPNRNGWWLKLWNHPKIMCTRWLLGMSWSPADKNHLYLLWNNLYKGKAPAERKKGLKVRVNPHGPEADFLSKK
jgi:hypothetical protein